MTGNELPPLPGADLLAEIHAAWLPGYEKGWEDGYRAGREDERTGRLHRRAVRIVHAMARCPEIEPKRRSA